MDEEFVSFGKLGFLLGEHLFDLLWQLLMNSKAAPSSLKGFSSVTAVLSYPVAWASLRYSACNDLRLHLEHIHVFRQVQT